MNLVCAICLERFTSDCDVLTTPCGHLFHNTCLSKSFTELQKTCPTCRKDCGENSHKVFLQCGSSEHATRMPGTFGTRANTSPAPSYDYDVGSFFNSTDRQPVQRPRSPQSVRQSATAQRRSQLSAEDLALIVATNQSIQQRVQQKTQQAAQERPQPIAWQPGMPQRPPMPQQPQMFQQQQRYQLHPDVVEYGWSDWY